MSVNFNKNEILKSAISDEVRQRVTGELKDYRNIILRIIEVINDKINNDYNLEISLDNTDGIKYEKEILIGAFLNEIDNKRKEIIAKFESKIHFEKYEFYANNIETINTINNKSYFELNKDLYYDILKNISKISPDYLDSESNLIKDKNSLFNLSKDIVNVINSEIKDINEYINSYSEKYFNINPAIVPHNLNMRAIFCRGSLLLVFKFMKFYKEIN